MGICILLAGADSVRKNRGLSLSAGPFGAIKSDVLIDVGLEALVEWGIQGYAGVPSGLSWEEDLSPSTINTRPLATQADLNQFNQSK